MAQPPLHALRRATNISNPPPSSPPRFVFSSSPFLFLPLGKKRRNFPHGRNWNRASQFSVFLCAVTEKEGQRTWRLLTILNLELILRIRRTTYVTKATYAKQIQPNLNYLNHVHINRDEFSIYVYCAGLITKNANMWQHFANS